MATTVKELVEDIKASKTQTSANAKDEVKVMKAMLNDPTYKVDVYSKKGVTGQYCPYEETRGVVTDILKSTTRMSNKEATELASTYEFDNKGAQAMVNLSKEFINTYVETGRKLPLGGREDSNISIASKIKEAKISSFPMATSVNANGEKVYSATPGRLIPEHKTLKVYSPVPAWIKND